MMGNFCNDRRGNVAVLFSVLLPLLLAGVGIAVDMSMANMRRTELQNAADAATIVGARSYVADSKENLGKAEKVARKVFDANAPQANGFEISDFKLDRDGDAFTVNVTGVQKTSFMHLVGRKTMAIPVLSEVKMASESPIELVMVLDNTLSMNGAKIDALKSAATSLVDIVMPESGGDTQIGLVPFSQYVKVGTHRRGESWLDAPDPATVTEPTMCHIWFPDYTIESCVWGSKSGAAEDGSMSTFDANICQMTKGTYTGECWYGDDVFEWYGCVGSRDHPLNLQDGDYLTNKIPGVLDINCAQEILPMSNNRTAVLDDIDSMFVFGETYIPIGLVWGWRLISNEWPFQEGASTADMSAKGGKKAIILMTDGENTRSPRPEVQRLHFEGNKSLADDYTSQLCEDIKASGITIYTIAFDVTDNETIKLLKKCASSPSLAFNEDDEEGLTSAFGEIGGLLVEMSLTR